MNFNPDGWMDIVAYVVIGLPAIIAAYATVRGHRANASTLQVHKKLAEATLYEVQNDHRSNLRDDIDLISQQISTGFSEVNKDLREIRADLRTERVERIEGDRPGGSLFRP